MFEQKTTLIFAVSLVVLLVPALFGVAAADSADHSQSQMAASLEEPETQPLFLDWVTDAIFGSDDDDDGGLLSGIFGSDDEPEYPDGFSEEGIEDFDTALGDESVHYNADSLSYDFEVVSDGSTEMQMAVDVSGQNQQAYMVVQTGDGTDEVFVDDDTQYRMVEPGAYRTVDQNFDRDQLYMVDGIIADLEAADFEHEGTDGDEIIYTADDPLDAELAVTELGELSSITVVDPDGEGKTIQIDFHGYGETTVEEPDWIDEAIEQETSPDEHASADERLETDDESIEAEPDDESDEIETEREEDTGVETDAISRADTEVLEERREHILEQIEQIDAEIEAIEDGTAGEDIREEIDELETRMEAEREQIAQFEAEIEAIEDGTHEEEHEADSQDERDELEQHRAELEERLEMVAELIDEHEREIEESEERIEELEERMADADDEEERERIDAEIEDSADSIDAQRETIRELEQRIRILEERIEDVEEDMIAIEEGDDPSSDEGEIEQLEERIESHQERIARGEREIETREERLAELDDRAEQLRAERDELEEMLDRIEAELDETE